MNASVPRSYFRFSYAVYNEAHGPFRYAVYNEAHGPFPFVFPKQKITSHIDPPWPFQSSPAELACERNQQKSQEIFAKQIKSKKFQLKSINKIPNKSDCPCPCVATSQQLTQGSRAAAAVVGVVVVVVVVLLVVLVVVVVGGLSTLMEQAVRTVLPQHSHGYGSTHDRPSLPQHICLSTATGMVAPTIGPACLSTATGTFASAQPRVW